MEWTLLLPILFAVIVSALGFLAYQYWQRQQAATEGRFRTLEQDVRQLTEWPEGPEEEEEEDDEDEEDQDEDGNEEDEDEDEDEDGNKDEEDEDEEEKGVQVGPAPHCVAGSCPIPQKSTAAAVLKEFMVTDNLFSILPGLSFARPAAAAATVRDVSDIPVTELSDQE